MCVLNASELAERCVYLEIGPTHTTYTAVGDKIRYAIGQRAGLKRPVQKHCQISQLKVDWQVIFLHNVTNEGIEKSLVIWVWIWKPGDARLEDFLSLIQGGNGECHSSLWGQGAAPC